MFFLRFWQPVSNILFRKMRHFPIVRSRHLLPWYKHLGLFVCQQKPRWPSVCSTSSCFTRTVNIICRFFPWRTTVFEIFIKKFYLYCKVHFYRYKALITKFRPGTLHMQPSTNSIYNPNLKPTTKEPPIFKPFLVVQYECHPDYSFLDEAEFLFCRQYRWHQTEPICVPTGTWQT